VDTSRNTAMAIFHSMSEDDIRTVLRHPGTMIGSDGLPTLEGKPHPRLYGTFALDEHIGEQMNQIFFEDLADAEEMTLEKFHTIRGSIAWTNPRRCSLPGCYDALAPSVTEESNLTGGMAECWVSRKTLVYRW